MLKLQRIFSKIKKIYFNEKGSALLTVLVLLLLFAILGSAVLITTTNNLLVSKRMSEYEDNYYIAETNAQYALTYLKEEIIAYYNDLKKIPVTQDSQYSSAIKDFYPSIIDTVFNDSTYFVPLDFSEEGVTTTVTFSIDPNTPLPTYNYGQPGNAVRFLIESVAESDTSRRVVNAVLEVDDPDATWHPTSAPPMTSKRVLVGDEIVMTEDLQNAEFNAIFCRGDLLSGSVIEEQFLTDHNELLGEYDYEFSSKAPKMLNWDLQYSKFPTHAAFDTFESLFAASTYGTSTYNSFSDWRTKTINYSITDQYAPNTYSNIDIIDSKVKESQVTLYFTQQDIIDSKSGSRYVGTPTSPVRVYAVGNLTLTGWKNLENCYIYAEGNITINVNGYIKDAIIISNGGQVNIDCYYIENTTEHMLIKAASDVNMDVDSGGVIKKVIARSKYGSININATSNISPYSDKVLVESCYLHTNKEDKDAMIYLRNVFAKYTYVSAGKDLVLRNCSGYKSAFYAFGTTDADIDTFGMGSLYATRCYNDSMQYSCNGYSHRWYRGIIFVTELPPKANRIYLEENTFRNCDFTTGQSVFLADPYYSITSGNQLVDMYQCRIIANREVLIEDVTMNGSYIFAGIGGYEDEQSIYYVLGKPKLLAARGIYMRLDHTHNEIKDCVLYTKGRMMYSQHTPEESGYPISDWGKVRVFSSLFYSTGNFEYNGVTASDGLDSSIMRSTELYSNNMIIMTEQNLGPHEFSPSVANDVLFIGGNMELDPDRPDYSGVLERIIGNASFRQPGNSLEVQRAVLYDNYFEQELTDLEMQREIPAYIDIFVYEDIYEKKEAGNGG